MLRKFAFVALLAMCLSGACFAEKSEFKHLYKKIKDVPGVAKGEDGQFYINVEEEKFYVVGQQSVYLLPVDRLQRLPAGLLPHRVATS